MSSKAGGTSVEEHLIATYCMNPGVVQNGQGQVVRTLDSKAEKRKNSVKLDKRFSKGNANNHSNVRETEKSQPQNAKQVNSETMSSI